MNIYWAVIPVYLSALYNQRVRLVKSFDINDPSAKSLFNQHFTKESSDIPRLGAKFPTIILPTEP